MIHLLMEHGVQVRADDYNDMGFMNALLSDPNADLLKLFKKLGAAQIDSSPLNVFNQIFLITAAERGSLETIQYLLNFFKQMPELPNYLSYQDAQGQTVLHKAATNLDAKVMRAFLAACKANSRKTLNILDNEGESALHKAVRDSNLTAIQLCDDYMFDFEQSNNSQHTLLHIAAKHANLKIIKYLLGDGEEFLQQHINVLAVDKDGQTALHLALHNKDIQVFEYLAQNYQSLLPISDSAAETVLHHAARAGNVRIIELCNEYQLDFTTRNQAGQTPLELAQQADQPTEAIQAIQEAMHISNLKPSEKQSFGNFTRTQMV